MIQEGGGVRRAKGLDQRGSESGRSTREQGLEKIWRVANQGDVSDAKRSRDGAQVQMERVTGEKRGRSNRLSFCSF